MYVEFRAYPRVGNEYSKPVPALIIEDLENPSGCPRSCSWRHLGLYSSRMPRSNVLTKHSRSPKTTS